MPRKSTARLVMSGAACAAVLLSTPTGSAQVARTELHQIRSVTLSDRQFLTGDKQGTPVTIAGALRIPRPGTDRLPAVILLHGSGGVGGNVDRWSQELNSIGIATFIVDSFTGRGLQTVSADQARLGRLNMIIDAYRALELIAAHPRIDAARIAVMGFSRGGQSVLYASMKRFQRMHGPEGLEFAAYVPFYPSCAATFIDDEDVSDRPIRIHHGSADDYVPVAPCRDYVERLRKAGKDVQLTEYPDAHHTFDNPFLKEGPQPAARSQTVRGCKMHEDAAGLIVNSVTRQPFSYQDPCVERGPNVGYNAAAHAAATQAVKEFLRATLKLN
jgi:dienelactone hydrolase